MVAHAGQGVPGLPGGIFAFGRLHTGAQQVALCPAVRANDRRFGHRLAVRYHLSPLQIRDDAQRGCIKMRQIGQFHLLRCAGTQHCAMPQVIERIVNPHVVYLVGDDVFDVEHGEQPSLRHLLELLAQAAVGREVLLVEE